MDASEREIKDIQFEQIQRVQRENKKLRDILTELRSFEEAEHIPNRFKLMKIDEALKTTEESGGEKCPECGSDDRQVMNAPECSHDGKHNEWHDLPKEQEES